MQERSIMGRGNVCVFGKYEGLYFVDKDYLNYYYKEDESELQINIDNFTNWEYDEDLSYINFIEFLTTFAENFQQKFPSFTIKQTEYCGIVLENNLFQVEIEDNEWSYAVKLLQIETNYDEPSKEGFQKKHFNTYLNGIKECLFEQFDTLGIYSGAWTSGIISKNDVA